MKLILFFSLFSLFSPFVLGQTPVDTTLSIQNIEIQGKRFAGLRGGPVRKLQIENNLSSFTGTAADGVRQLPSVVMDMEGGVTYRGSNKPGMFINGIPYGLMEEYSGDVLIQLPALFFNRISLTQFPSINLVPDGDAGVMNFASAPLTKSDPVLQLTLGAGWDERYNAGGVLNVHPGKFHITAKYNYRREYRERTFSKSTTTSKNRTEMNNNASARPDVHLADLNVGYDLSKQDQISVYGLYYLMDYSRYGRINNKVFNPKGEQMKYVIRNRYNDQQQQAYATEATWKHTFANRGVLLTVFNYNNFSYDEDNDFKNENPANGQIVAEDRSFFNQEKHNYYWQMGYSQLLSGNWKLNAGYIGRAKRENYLTAAHDKVDNHYELNDAKSYNYQFDRYVNLLYASVAKSWGAFDVEVGLQAELTHQKMHEYSPSWVNKPSWAELVGTENKRSVFHLYPRVCLGYLLNKDNQLTFSYLQRVIRPAGSNLSSFLDNSDVTHLIQGNPSLKNEIVHSLDLGYQFTTSRFRLSPSLYYRNRANRIMEVATQIDDETIWKKENFGHSQTFGFDLSANWNPVKFMAIGIAGDVYRDEIDGRTIGYDEKKSLVCWDVKGNVNFYITPTTELQIDGFYVSDQLTPQGKILDYYTVNAGLSQYFMQRRLRANLSIHNIFDSLGETTIIHTEALKMEQVRNRDARATWLTLTYNL